MSFFGLTLWPMKDNVFHVRWKMDGSLWCQGDEALLWYLMSSAVMFVLLFQTASSFKSSPWKLTSFTFLVQVFIELFRERLGWKPGGGSSCFITVVTAGSVPDVRHLEWSRHGPHSDAGCHSYAFGETEHFFLGLIQGKSSDRKHTWRVGKGMKKIEYFYYRHRDKFSYSGLFWNS